MKFTSADKGNVISAKCVPISARSASHLPFKTLDEICVVCRIYYGDAVLLPTRLAVTLLPLAAIVGKFTALYGHWGYCSSNPFRAWFPLACIAAALTLYGWYGMVRLTSMLRVR